MATSSRLLLALLAAAVLIGAAVAAVRTEAPLSIETALQAALDNGFDAVIWKPTPEMRREAEELAETTGEPVVGISGAGQIVIPRGRAITDVELVEQPLLILWLPSAEVAAMRLEADRRLREGRLTALERALLPRDFDVARLTEARACNFAVASYDDGTDPSLRQRVQATIEDLRERC